MNATILNTKSTRRRLLTAAVILILLGGNVLAQESGRKAVLTDSAMLQPWTGPYGGIPPWHLVRPHEFVDAFERAIEISQAEIETIANNPDPATFENTIVAMEDSGRTLNRLDALFGVHAGNLNVGPLPDIQKTK